MLIGKYILTVSVGEETSRMGRVRVDSPFLISSKPMRKAFPVLTLMGPWSINGLVLKVFNCITQRIRQSVMTEKVFK